MNPHRESLDLIRHTLKEIKKYPQFLLTKKRNLHTSYVKPSLLPSKKLEPIFLEKVTDKKLKDLPTQKDLSTISTQKILPDTLQTAPIKEISTQVKEASLPITSFSKTQEKLEVDPPEKPQLYLPKSSQIEHPNPIKLEKTQPTTSSHSLSIKKHLLSLDPNLPLIDNVLDDIKAKERLKRGVCLYATAILVFEKDREKLNFLKNLEKTVSNKFLPAKLYDGNTIEKENDWESFLSSKSLKLIIATDHEIFHAKNLMKLYKELPNQSKRMVKDIDLFLLPDINLYFKQPILKRSLYKALCHKIQML